jgi:hypothetical protein
MKEFETGRLWLYPFKVWQRERFAGQFIHDSDITDMMIEEYMAVEHEQYMPPQYRRSNWRPMPVG